MRHQPSACEAATPRQLGPGTTQNDFANEIAEAEA